MLILAVVNWQIIGLFISISVSLLAAILSFIKGNKSEKSLQTSQMVQTTFEGQSKLNDNLQKEVLRVGVVADDCEHRCAELQKLADKARADLGVANARIRKLSDREQLHKEEITVLKTKIADLQDKVSFLNSMKGK